MLNQIIGWTVYCGVIAGILFAGWNEPLRFRFLSSAELAQERNPNSKVAAPTQPVTSWRPAGSTLDRAPYDVKHGQINFSQNYDPRKAGTVTEAPGVVGKTHTGPSAP